MEKSHPIEVLILACANCNLTVSFFFNMKDTTSLSFKLKIITSEDNYPIGTILHTVVKKIADSFKKWRLP